MSYKIANGTVKCPTLVDGFISEKCGFLKLVARLLSFEQWILFAPFSSKVRESDTPWSVPVLNKCTSGWI